MLFWLRILRFRDIIGVLGGFRILSQILITDRTKSEMVMRGQWQLRQNSDSEDRHKCTGGGTLDNTDNTLAAQKCKVKQTRKYQQ